MVALVSSFWALTFEIVGELSSVVKLWGLPGSVRDPDALSATIL